MKFNLTLLYRVFLYTLFLGASTTICLAQEGGLDTVLQKVINSEQKGSPIGDSERTKLESEIAGLIRNFKYKDAVEKLDILFALHNSQREKGEMFLSDQALAKNLILQAQCYKKLYQFPQAISILTQMSNSDTSNVQILSELADCRLQSGDFRECAQVYTRMLDLDSTNTYFEMQRALVNVKGEYWLQALAGFQNLCRRGDSTNNVVLRLLGDCYYNIGEGNLCLKYYHKAIEIKPTDHLAVRKLATMYLNLTMAQNAVAVTNGYRKLDTTNIEVNRLNGIAKYVTRDFAGAITILDTLFVHGDDSFSTNYYLGLSKAAIYHYYEAIPHFEIAYEYDTTNVSVVYLLGDAHCNSQLKEKRGIELLRQGLQQMQPKVEDLVKYHVSMAKGYAGLGNYPQAIKCMEKVYELDSKYTDALYQLAIYYENQKKYEKATDYYREFYEKTPDKRMLRVAEGRFERLLELLFMEGIEIKPLKKRDTKAAEVKNTEPVENK